MMHEAKVWREATSGTSSTGGKTTTWSVEYSRMPLDLQAEKAKSREDRGDVERTRYRAWVMRGHTLQSDDVMKVTAGRHAGRYLRIRWIEPSMMERDLLLLEETETEPDG